MLLFGLGVHIYIYYVVGWCDRDHLKYGAGLMFFYAVLDLLWGLLGGVANFEGWGNFIRVSKCCATKKGVKTFWTVSTIVEASYWCILAFLQLVLVLFLYKYSVGHARKVSQAQKMAEIKKPKPQTTSGHAKEVGGKVKDKMVSGVLRV